MKWLQLIGRSAIKIYHFEEKNMCGKDDVGPWRIRYVGYHWEYTHEDYDVAPDSSDYRCGLETSYIDCLVSIIELQNNQLENA